MTYSLYQNSAKIQGDMKFSVVSDINHLKEESGNNYNNKLNSDNRLEFGYDYNSFSMNKTGSLIYFRLSYLIIPQPNLLRIHIMDFQIQLL